jgi:hypothetical protein
MGWVQLLLPQVHVLQSGQRCAEEMKHFSSLVVYLEDGTTCPLNLRGACPYSLGEWRTFGTEAAMPKVGQSLN